MQFKLGGKFHLKLNIGGRPIANKYREGKMKRTLKRELKVPEIEPMEPLGSSVGCGALMLVTCCWRRALRQVRLPCLRGKSSVPASVGRVSCHAGNGL